MNFEDEPYVRLFIRRTLTNKRLKWDGRAVMHEMLYIFDRAGVFEFDGPIESAIEDMTELPERVVKSGLKRLLETGTWVMREGFLVWPNYLEAQTATRSDVARQRESRQRRMAVARASEALGPDSPERRVTPRDEESQGVTEVTGFVTEIAEIVTPGHVTQHRGEPRDATRTDAPGDGAGTTAVTMRDAQSQGVTETTGSVTFGHVQSQPVTLSLALHSRAEREKTPLPPAAPEPPRPPPADPFGETLGPKPPGKRPDVLRVWEAFKRALAYAPKTKFRGPWDDDAKRIADAIDAYDEATCLAVVEQAPQDGMVNGTQDERDQKHDSVAYVFENQNTFNRLLRAAEAKKRRQSGVGALERAMNAEPDLTDYRDPEVA